MSENLIVEVASIDLALFAAPVAVMAERPAWDVPLGVGARA